MKKQFALLIAGLFAGSIFAFSTSAHAVDTTGTVDYTDGGITFDPQVPGNASASLPKNLNFGSHAIQTKVDETWTATSDGYKHPLQLLVKSQSAITAAAHRLAGL